MRANIDGEAGAERESGRSPGTSKPLLRGVLHQWAALAALAAGIVLTAMAPTARAGLAAAIFGTSLFVLFAVSATYHRPTWGPVARAWMRRADHASIFLLIAGTYTPVCLLALEPEPGTRGLLLVWGGATLGVLQSLFWIRAPKFVAALLGLGVGWSVVPYMGEVRGAVSTAGFVLLVLGGLLYSVGAVAYATKWPNPRPHVFGYHEVFHALTIIAALLHFVFVAMLVKAA